MDGQTDSQADIQRVNHSDWQNRQADRQADIKASTQARGQLGRRECRQLGRKGNRHSDGQTSRLTDKHEGKQTDRQPGILGYQFTVFDIDCFVVCNCCSSYATRFIMQDKWRYQCEHYFIRAISKCDFRLCLRTLWNPGECKNAMQNCIVKTDV